MSVSYYLLKMVRSDLKLKRDRETKFHIDIVGKVKQFQKQEQASESKESN